MTDTLTPEQRHDRMASVKGKNTKPEMIVRRYLHSLGFRYGLHNKSLPGSPDMVLRKYKTVIFIHGCFWHGHEGCPLFRIPKSNVEFWKNKIRLNQIRDIKVQNCLKQKGWNVITIWECDLKVKSKREETLQNLRNFLERLKNREYKSFEEPSTQIAAEPITDYKSLEHK